MRMLCLAGLSAVFLLAARGSADVWRPDYLDLGDQVIKVGPPHIITLTDSDPDQETITGLSVSPDGKYAVVVLTNGEHRTLQVVSLGLTERQTRLALSDAEGLGDSCSVQWAAGSQALMVTKSGGLAAKEIRVAKMPFAEITIVPVGGSWECPMLSPDGNRIAYLVDRGDGGGRNAAGLYYFDVVAGREVLCDELRGSALGWKRFGWTPDQTISLVRDNDRRRPGDAAYMMLSVNLTDHWRRMQPSFSDDPREVSPDGRRRFETGMPRVDDTASTMTTLLSKDMEMRPLQWEPKGRFLLVSHADQIKDELGRVHRELAQVWLLKVSQEDAADEDPGRALDDRLLAIVDAQTEGPAHEAMAAMTSDRRRIVYIADNQLRTRELHALRGDAADAAREGHEQVLQEAALSNAKQIATALAMYSDDWDGKLPDPETVIEDLRDYMKSPDTIFRHPEIPEMNCFEYHPPEHLRLDGIADPANTALGWLDWGRGWAVVLFADGHCQVVEKKRK
jgi:hypothetical protein